MFARCAQGFEALLGAELRSLGMERVRPLKGGVAFFGGIEDLYRACLWSRLATRIQVVLARVDAPNAQALYDAAAGFCWEDHVAPGATIAVRAHGTNANLRNTQFTALKVKDALCDRMRATTGVRPSVDAKDPGFAVDVSVRNDRATLYLNASGPALHKRGYRESGVQALAPLKETLAAGVLHAAGWTDEYAEQVVADLHGSGGGTSRCVFTDPLCGSGTLAIEAALVLSDTAPGILRTRWGFQGWRFHDPLAWERVHGEALKRHECGLSAVRGAGLVLSASDADAHAVELARSNAERAGVADIVDFRVADAAHALDAVNCAQTGLLATNPPYGQRLGDAADLVRTYDALAHALDAVSEGWVAAVITPDSAIDSALGVQPEQVLPCFNGPIEAAVRVYRLATGRMPRLSVVSLAGVERSVPVLEQGSGQFAARLRKVAKQRAKWARSEGVVAYRIYDADLPDYSLAIDVYQGAGLPESGGTDVGRPGSADAPPRTYVRVAEYRAPATVDPALAQRRFADACAIVPAVLDVEPECLFTKVRTRAKGGSQYADARGSSFAVRVKEGRYIFEVDLNGHVDTGLFLDMRPVRAMIEGMAGGKHFLNLFAYTGSASVFAAGGGAASTTSVDLSRTYLDWAQRNMRANGFLGVEHSFERSDVIEWLDRAVSARRSFDLVFCDPPTFSNSKAMGRATFDVQRDHARLFGKIARVLSPGGTIVFACNRRTFKIDRTALEDAGLSVRDVTPETIPPDFARTPKIHQCFLVTHAAF